MTRFCPKMSTDATRDTQPSLWWLSSKLSNPFFFSVLSFIQRNKCRPFTADWLIWLVVDPSASFRVVRHAILGGGGGWMCLSVSFNLTFPLSSLLLVLGGGLPQAKVFLSHLLQFNCTIYAASWKASWNLWWKKENGCCLWGLHWSFPQRCCSWKDSGRDICCKFHFPLSNRRRGRLSSPLP